MKTNKYIVSFDLYRNDEWQDLEKVMISNSESEALHEFKLQFNLAKNITIKKHE